MGAGIGASKRDAAAANRQARLDYRARHNDSLPEDQEENRRCAIAHVRWTGGGVAVSQITNVTPAGTIETGDIFRYIIGNKRVSFASTATTIAAVVSAGVTAWNASTEPEFAEVTAVASGTTSITLTADVAGKPFTVSTTTVEADGSTSDSQTFTTTTAGTSNDGPNVWGTAANWDINTVPVSSDDVWIENNAVSILYGLNTSTVILETLNIAQNYTGNIGLPLRNSGGYPEYRETELNISTKVLRIGYGSGAGSGRIKINNGTTSASTSPVAVNIINSGTPLENGVEAILIRATNSSNTIQVLKGSVGVAITGGTTSNFSGGVNIGYTNQVATDSKVRFGAGCSLAAFNQRGGEVETNSAITSLTQTDGTHTKNAGAVTTQLVVDGGRMIYNSTGTVAIGAIGSRGILDLSKDMRSVTFTTLDMWAGASLLDPFQRGTYSNAIDLNRCGLQEVTLDLGINRRLTPGTPA